MLFGVLSEVGVEVEFEGGVEVGAAVANTLIPDNSMTTAIALAAAFCTVPFFNRNMVFTSPLLQWFAALQHLGQPTHQTIFFGLQLSLLPSAVD